MLKGLGNTLYVQIRADRMRFRCLESGESLELAAPAPFTHERLLVGSFTRAQTLFIEGTRRARRAFLPPTVVVHPLEKVEGGLSEVEERVLQELALGAGARRAVVWVGKELGDGEIREKLAAA